jgi:hypothetical protein
MNEQIYNRTTMNKMKKKLGSENGNNLKNEQELNLTNLRIYN